MSMGSLTLFANAQFIAYLLVLYFTKWVICNTKKWGCGWGVAWVRQGAAGVWQAFGGCAVGMQW